MKETVVGPETRVLSGCPGDQQLVAVLSGDQPVEDWLAGHLAGCADCQTRLDRLSDTSPLSQFREHLHPVPGPETCLEPPVRPGDLGMLEGIAVEALIGRGGMGIVYRGRDERLGRPVAVKFLRELDGGRGVDRFLRESRAAAGLSHDHLVPVYSSGVARDGRPWLVMPLVEGESLRERISRAPPDFRATALIIREVALGLAAVHSAGLVHRDVKPANILLDRLDGRAKLTDFGLARSESDATLTGTNMLCGTPEYMSPEQAANPESRDPRGDIYSLGITLYECLTGSTPFRGRPLDVLEQHRTNDPVPPHQLNRQVPRELETVCLKAMAREPARRYESAHAFAEDLRRWLDGEAILARPEGHLARTRRWVRRNRTAVLAASVVAATLAASTATSGWYAYRADQARRQSDRDAGLARSAETTAQAARAEAEEQRSTAQKAEGTARREAARAKETLNTLIDAFRSADPNEGATGDLSARALLLAARDNIKDRLADDPAGRIELLGGLGESLAHIGENEEAARVFAEAIELATEALGENHPDTLSLLSSRGTSLSLAGRNEEALPLLEAAFARQTEIQGLSGVDRLRTGIALTNALGGLGRQEEAMATIGPVATECERSLGPRDETTWFAWDALAMALNDAGLWNDAHPVFLRAWQARREVLGPDHLQSFESLNLLGQNELSRGNFAEAVRIGREVVEGRSRLLGAGHPDTLKSMGNLGFYLLCDGQLEEAHDWLSQTVILLRQRPPSAEQWIVIGNQANACTGLKRFDEAIALHEEALAAKRAALGPENPSTVISLANLARTLDHAGEHQRAGELGTECLDLCRKVFGPEHPSTLVMTGNVASFLDSAGQTAEALALHRSNLVVLERVNGPDHPDTANAINDIAHCLKTLGQFEEGIEWGRRAVTLHEKALGPDHPETIGAMRNLAECLRQTRAFDEAIPLARQVVDRETARNGATAESTLKAVETLAQLKAEAAADQ